ncbi:MAG: acetyltransferase [Anaerolineales bacterium]|jgi:sugar O-acyltransferase (sialic acid O-acetyltransferase NeuD family)
MTGAIGASSSYELPKGPFDKRSVVIYGGGGHGRSIIDLVRTSGAYEILGIIDDGIQPGERVMGCDVLGDENVLSELYSEGLRHVVNAVGAIGDIDPRIAIFRKLLDMGYSCPTVIHPSAVVEPSAMLDSGVQVLPQSYIGTEAKVGFGVIINNGAIVSHDCELGAYSGLAPGTILAGGVTVGEGVQIGLGVTVNLNVTIGDKARIGNSAVVKADVPSGGVVYAGQVWPPRNDNRSND